MCGAFALCCSPAKERGCCCFNLSVAVLVVATFYALIGGLDTYQTYQVEPLNKLTLAGGFITAAVGAYLYLCVALGCLKLGKIAWAVTMPAVLATLILALIKLAVLIDLWIKWGDQLNEGAIEFQTVMVTATVSNLMSMCISFGFANIFWSAACVWKVGGSGCEFKNYEDIEKSKEKV